MGDLKGILALFTACISICVVLNFLLFYKKREIVADGIILGALLFANQLIEFVTSFWMIDNKVINLFYIMTFNFTISFTSYYLLKHIQPESKHNWKAFMFSILLLPAGFVYLSSFKMIDSGFFFSTYRYFASPLASCVVGMIQTFFGLYFLYRHFYSGADIKNRSHYKFLLWCYSIPPVVFIASLLISADTVLYFESIYSKLLLLSTGSLIYFLVKQERYAGNNS